MIHWVSNWSNSCLELLFRSSFGFRLYYLKEWNMPFKINITPRQKVVGGIPSINYLKKHWLPLHLAWFSHYIFRRNSIIYWTYNFIMAQFNWPCVHAGLFVSIVIWAKLYQFGAKPGAWKDPMTKWPSAFLFLCYFLAFRIARNYWLICSKSLSI